jgi:hypothetical protein
MCNLSSKLDIFGTFCGLSSISKTLQFRVPVHPETTVQHSREKRKKCIFALFTMNDHKVLRTYFSSTYNKHHIHTLYIFTYRFAFTPCVSHSSFSHDGCQPLGRWKSFSIRIIEYHFQFFMENDENTYMYVVQDR